MSARLRAAAWSVGGPLLLFLITVGFCWRVVLTDQYTWLESPDLSFQVMPWLQEQAGEWRAGHIPLWDPYHWLGQPLLGQAQPGVVNPLNWLLFAVPLKHGWIRQAAMHWYFVLLHFIAALGMYWLCRDLDRSRWAAIIAAAVFAFGGFVGTNDWPQMLSGAIWAPFVLLFLLRSVRGQRPWGNAALSGLFWGLSWLSGHHQIPIFLSLALAGVWLYWIFEGGRLRIAIASRAALAVAVFMLVSAVQTIPALEYGRIAKRWAGLPDPIGWDQKVPYSEHQANSFTPDSLPGIVLPGIHRHADGFIGGIALTLALLGFWVYRSKPLVDVAAGIAFGGLLLAMGAYTVIHGVLYALVPMVEKARSPCMAILLFNFGIAILTAFGADVLRELGNYAEKRRAALALLCFGGAILALSTAITIAKWSVYDDRAIASALLCASAGAVILWMLSPHRSTRALPVLLMLLIFCELSQVFAVLEPSRYNKERTPYLAKMAQGSDIVEYLRSRPQPVRIDVDDKLLPFNFGDWYGVEQMGGYLASLTANMTFMEGHMQRAQQLFGVGYFVGKEAKFPGQELVFEGADGLKLFRSADVFPRTWLIHQVKQVPDRRYTTTFISDPRNDLRKSSVMVGDIPRLQNCQGLEDSVLYRHSSGRVTINATAACDAMVVLSDTYTDGWQATVDGKPARIWEPYGVLRGVVVGAGNHVIDMEYRPAAVVWGAILSCLGILLAIAAQFFPFRRGQ